MNKLRCIISNYIEVKLYNYLNYIRENNAKSFLILYERRGIRIVELENEIIRLRRVLSKVSTEVSPNPETLDYLKRGRN